MEHIVIAGAGIIGASIAYHLAKRGAKVTIFEAERPAAGASGKSFGWINATFSKRPRPYYDLSLFGIEGWHRLEHELHGALQVQWGGTVGWLPAGPDAEQLRDDIANHRDWGYAVRTIGLPEFHRLLPNVSPGDIATACHCEPEGAVDPTRAVSVLLDAARQLGADVRNPCRVSGLDLAGGRVGAVQTTQDTVDADTVVLACGTGSPALAELAGVKIPLKDAPGILVHTAPQPPLIDRIVIAPEVHFRQDGGGCIVIGGQLVAGAGTAATPLADAEQIFHQASCYLPALAAAKIDHVTLGYRVMPQDEYPIIGFADASPNLYIAATHSGVTLAPIVGQLAAAEILDRVQRRELEAYRPARFG